MSRSQLNELYILIIIIISTFIYNYIIKKRRIGKHQFHQRLGCLQNLKWKLERDRGEGGMGKDSNQISKQKPKRNINLVKDKGGKHQGASLCSLRCFLLT